MMRALLGIVGLATTLAGVGGCDRSATTTAGSATGPALDPAAARWSAAEAVGHLGDPNAAISAAVRLVRLGGLAPLGVPAEDRHVPVGRLRVRPVGESRWALGIEEAEHGDWLRAPVLIAADGGVQMLAEGVNEETLVLRVSDDADVYPHVLAWPERVALLEEQAVPALTLSADQRVCFELRLRERFPYVALVTIDRPAREIAEYRWDPYEHMFLGPARDKLPDPPGGEFAIDMAASPRLVPQGGLMDEPLPPEQRPPPKLRRPSGPADGPV